MLQTDRKTEQTRQTAQDRENPQRKQNLDRQADAALALEAILAGGSWEQLPADGVLTLSHTLGNTALLELAALRSAGPETVTGAMPQAACETAPMRGDGGAPVMTETPAFGAMSSVGGASPLAL